MQTGHKPGARVMWYFIFSVCGTSWAQHQLNMVFDCIVWLFTCYPVWFCAGLIKYATFADNCNYLLCDVSYMGVTFWVMDVWMRQMWSFLPQL